MGLIRLSTVILGMQHDIHKLCIQFLANGQWYTVQNTNESKNRLAISVELRGEDPDGIITLHPNTAPMEVAPENEIKVCDSSMLGQDSRAK